MTWDLCVIRCMYGFYKMVMVNFDTLCMQVPSAFLLSSIFKWGWGFESRGIHLIDYSVCKAIDYLGLM